MAIEKKYDFRKRLLQIHQPDIRNTAYAKKENEYMFADAVSISIPQSAEIVLITAAWDFADFLNTSMGIRAGVALEDKDAAISVDLAANCGVDLGEFATYKGFKITTDEKGVKVVAHDERGAAQALYYIEDLMTFAKAPVMEYGSFGKRPMFSPQMIHSGYGIDEYPEEYLARVAHEGRDAILIFTKDVNKTTCGYINFNELIDRAAKYGLDVYAYSYMKSPKSPYDDDAEEYYEGTYGKLFRECPGLKGVLNSPAKIPVFRRELILKRLLTESPPANSARAGSPATITRYGSILSKKLSENTNRMRTLFSGHTTGHPATKMFVLTLSELCPQISAFRRHLNRLNI